MKQISGLILLTIFSLKNSFAEDWSWWNNKHNWDQISSWESYMQLSSKYSGPNAIPVPEITNGTIHKYSYLEAGIAGHTTQGDQTANIVLSSLVKAGEKAAIGLYFVPYEIYNMDTNTSRNIRNTRDYDGKGSAVGDVYISGYYQLLKCKPDKNGIDMLITFGVRTASGNNLQAARYTDCPGYYFHVSAGRTIHTKWRTFSLIRHYIMTGAYMWQTYRKDYHQDDSFLWGVGLTLENKNFSVDQQVGGYYGYINNGDRPLVTRFSITTTQNTFFNFRLLLQYGFQDAPYKSVVLSSMLNLEKVISKKKR